MIKRISISFSENVSSDEGNSNQDETSKKHDPSLYVKKRKSKSNIRQHLLTLKKPTPKKLKTYREENDKSKTKKRSKERCTQTFEIIPPKNAIKIKKNACNSDYKNNLLSPQKQRGTNVKYGLPRSKGDALLVDVSLPGNINIKSSNRCRSDDSVPESEEFEYVPEIEDYAREDGNSRRKMERWEIKANKSKGEISNLNGTFKFRNKSIAAGVNNKEGMLSSDSNREYIGDSGDCQVKRWTLTDKPIRKVTSQNKMGKAQNKPSTTGMKDKSGLFSSDYSKLYSGDSQNSSDFVYRFNECKPKDADDSYSSDSKSSANTVIVQNIFYQKEQFDKVNIDKSSHKTDINHKNKKQDIKSEPVKQKSKQESKLIKKTYSETWKERKYREIASILYKIPQSIGFKVKTDPEKNQRCEPEEYTVGYLKDTQSRTTNQVTNVEESRDCNNRTVKTNISKESMNKSSKMTKTERVTHVEESKDCNTAVKSNTSKESISKSSRMTKLEVTNVKGSKRTLKLNMPKESVNKGSDKKLKNPKVVVNIPAVNKNKVFKKVGLTYTDNNSKSSKDSLSSKNTIEKVGMFQSPSTVKKFQPKDRVEKSAERKSQDKKVVTNKIPTKKTLKEPKKNIKEKPSITHMHDVSFEVPNEESIDTKSQSEDPESVVTLTPTSRSNAFTPSDITGSDRPSTEASPRAVTEASPVHQIFRSSSSLNIPESASTQKKTVHKPAEDRRRIKTSGPKTPDPSKKVYKVIVSKGNDSPAGKKSTYTSSKHVTPQKSDESGVSPRKTNKPRLGEVKEDEENRKSTPKLYIDQVTANRNVSSELLNKFNSGSEMSSILYEKRASPKEVDEPTNVNDVGSKSTKKNKFKPLVYNLDRDKVQMIDTKEKLKKFNMGDEMSLALYGTSNNVEKSQGECSATANQPKPVVVEGENYPPVPVNLMRNPAANQGEYLHPHPATLRDNVGNVIRADITDPLEYMGNNPINRVIADNLLNASTNPEMAAIKGLPQSSPIIIYCPIDYRKFNRGAPGPAYNYTEGHITPHLEPIEYQSYHQPSPHGYLPHQNYHLPPSEDCIPQQEVDGPATGLMYVPMEAGQQVRPIEYYPRDEMDMPGWSGRKIGVDSSSGSEMAHILYGGGMSAPMSMGRPAAGCDGASTARRRCRGGDDGVESAAKWRQNGERRPCGIYPGLIVDDGDFDM